MKFTKEEIKLCKQIAKRHRKLIEHGDWFIDTEMGVKPFLSQSLQHYRDNLFLLWTISDCLEFLREKGFYYVEIEVGKTYAFVSIKKQGELRRSIGGKVALEACLRAVLAVLEEKE